MIKKTVVIGGAGNVGSGIVKAFKKAGWKVDVIDPQANSSFEKLKTSEVTKLFSLIDHIIYSAEIGNRDTYTDRPKLGLENNRRFSNFCKTVRNVNPNIAIWYVGGSWTKRQPGSNWVVNDNSPNKKLSECNPYEKAKISAEKNAWKLSKGLNIRFLDWASIVPNMSENFSIPKMVTQALNEGKITYSPGPYGRPLLETLQAGEALITLLSHDEKNKRFSTHLIPGAFVSFSKFASVAKSAVEKETKNKIKLEKQTTTPSFLKTKTKSEYLKNLGFTPNYKRALKALAQNSSKYVELLASNV
jgi:nucleoside-diphosphate-sugar epimerase